MRGKSPEETGVEVLLVRRSPFRWDQGARSQGVKKRSTVGRLCDLPWVGETTYSRFFRRPTVGRFLTPSEVPYQAVWRGPLLSDEDEGRRRMRVIAPDLWGVPNGDFPNFAPSSQRGASGKPQDDLQTRKPGTYAGPILI